MEEQQRIEIGRRMHKLREASPQTNRSIADHVGVGERAVANWMSGATGIEYGHCKAVASLFKVDVQWLWNGDEKAGGTPDLMGAFESDRSQLDRVEQKLDALLNAFGVSPEAPSPQPTHHELGEPACASGER